MWSLSSLREPFWAPQDGKPRLGLVVQEPQGFAPNWPSESFCTGPGTDPRLFLEAVASFKHLLFSFPTFPDWGQVSSVLVPAQCHHIPVLCYARALPSPGAVGFLFGPDPGSPKCAQATGWHQDGGCHPFVPVSPVQGMKPASGKRSRLWGISYQPSYVPAEFQQGAMLCASHRHLHVLPGICVCLGWI